MTTNRKTTILAVGTMLALAGTGAAGAATKASATAATQATCDALMKQADSALTAHKTSTNAKAAQKLRDDGSKECHAGSYAKGAEHLRHAITDLCLVEDDMPINLLAIQQQHSNVTASHFIPSRDEYLQSVVWINFHRSGTIDSPFTGRKYRLRTTGDFRFSERQY